MTTLCKKEFTGERALFKSNGLNIKHSVFFDGESPLKESENLEIAQSTFEWKYPLWYTTNVKLSESTLSETARSGIWYTNDIEISNTQISAPKTFRRSNRIKLTNVSLPNATETFWSCRDIVLNQVSAKGDYFGMNSENIEINQLDLEGNYSFDGVKNIVVRDSRLISKDAFWNSENVVVYNSIISGEYLGWNSKNLTFINCTIESLQGLCYIENLVMIDCSFVNTTLAFEYSTVDITSKTTIDSIFNPTSGKIKAPAIGSIVLDDTKIDPRKTTITLE